MSIMAAKRQIPETLFDDLGFRMTYEAKRVLYEAQTEHQHLVLFEHSFFGKVLMLDGATQVTTASKIAWPLASRSVTVHQARRRRLNGSVIRSSVIHRVSRTWA